MPDAIQLLTEEHAQVKKLMKQIDETTERAVKTREELFTQLKMALMAHETIEEEIFYPALRDNPRTRELILESYEEHGFVDMIMADLDGVPYDDETWAAKFKVMMENVEHHAIEEEEGKLFPKARQILRDELDDLGARMEARGKERKQELETEMGAMTR